MPPECARPRPLSGARPQSGVGTTDVGIVGPDCAQLNMEQLPVELVALAEAIAACIAARQGGST